MGRRYGVLKLPYNRDKSWVGSICMCFSGFTISIGYVSAIWHFLILISNCISRLQTLQSWIYFVNKPVQNGAMIPDLHLHHWDANKYFGCMPVQAVMDQCAHHIILLYLKIESTQSRFLCSADKKTCIGHIDGTQQFFCLAGPSPILKFEPMPWSRMGPVTCLDHVQNPCWNWNVMADISPSFFFLVSSGKWKQ